MESNQSRRVPGVTAIILAAGENRRLQSIVAPYQKPLLLINGQPLIRHAIHHARNEWQCGEFVIVCSPNNAREITALCGEEPRYILQPRASGVMNAISLGLQAVHTSRTLIMCADNIFELFEGTSPYDKHLSTCGIIGTSKITDKRFTRLKVDKNQMITTSDDYEENVSWLGPLYHNTDDFNTSWCNDVETFIKSLPNLFSFPMNCSDLGVPEAL